jgi:isoleucyl-tRNA synthetase
MEKNTLKSQSALREEEVLKFWKENEIFKKSLEKGAPKGEYVFYEGPPTANGKPGIHHLEARAFKDVIPRYKTMKGYHVRRKGGWDTHGLPVELQVEKELGLKSKKEIEEYGIAKFNQQCKESVWKYVDLWEKFTERIGFWVDQKNPYVTYHNNYIESVWNVIKEANNQKLLYKDYKVVPWCPRCETGLSSHELAQGYENVKDLSVYVKFKVRGQENTYILAWTTTPWTLPGNVALAVGEKIDYVKIKPLPNLPLSKGEEKEGVYLILAKARLSVIEGGYEIEEELKGKDLIGLEYEPLYPYLSNTIPDSEKPKLEKSFKIYGADFVTTEDGTGVVHTAVMYGQDDFELGTKIGLPKHHLVGLDGKFLAGTDFLEGRFVRDEEVAVDIIKDLAHRGLLFKKEKYEHSYPHCWRCHTALIYYARDSWYIRMSSLRDKLVKENEGINWEPSYIKEGRFGEWLREIKDWAISRERYWGSPLPVWTCDKCKKIEVIGSIKDLKSKTKKSGNKYFVMRHGEADSNVLEICSSDPNDPIHLTEKGKQQIKESIKEFKNEKFDYIFISPLLRAIETSNVVKSELNLSCPIVVDNRIREYGHGEFNGKPVRELRKLFKNKIEEFTIRPKNGECVNDVKKRVSEFLYDIESKYKNKKILIITHGDPAWMMNATSRGMTNEQSVKFADEIYPKTGEMKELDFIPLPHSEDYELDLHKPYIDEVELVCAHSTSSGQACGGKLERAKEVMDVWLDSGTMPFSQDHYPFDPEPKQVWYGAGNKKSQKLLYPADFICEAIDQTRGWFYTLHAVGVIMGKGKAYKNVICLGHLLDANGKKMSKSLGNIVDPWSMMEKYGVDTLRLWMYSVNQPGESKNFDEKTVAELHSKVFNLLYNVLAFYELYRDKDLEILQGRSFKGSSQGPSLGKNVLDQWILARLAELVDESTKRLDDYKLLEPVRAVRDFIDDLSTWYLRRSRERIKNGDKETKKTLYHVLKTLIKLMAPFTPFASEDIWQKLKNEKDEESVHLTKWPEKQIINYGVVEKMNQAREIVERVLFARQLKKKNVRQPLAELRLGENYSLPPEYFEILKDELNIKNISLVKKEGVPNNLDKWFAIRLFYDNPDETILMYIDSEITEELKQEGNYRELVRAIQDIRKKKGLNPNDMVSIKILTNVDGQEFLNKFKTELMKAVSAKEIQMKENEGTEVKIDGLVFVINMVK